MYISENRKANVRWGRIIKLDSVSKSKIIGESIFLTGLPRSGTTWAAKMFSFSPSVNYISGEPFNPGFSKELFGYDWLWYYAISGQENVEFNHNLKNIFNQSWSFEDFKRRLQFLIKSDNKNIKPYLRIIKLFYFYLCRNNRVTLLKDPTGFFSTEQISAMFNSKVILMTRHPAAFIESMMRVKWEFNFDNIYLQKHLKCQLEEYWDLIEYYAQNSLSIKPLDKHILIWNIYHHLIFEWGNKHKDWTIVSHEQLSANPVNEFKQLYNKLNLEYNEKVEDSIIEYTKSSNETLPGNQVQQLKRNSISVTEIWKHNLGQGMIDEILKKTENNFNRFYK